MSDIAAAFAALGPGFVTTLLLSALSAVLAVVLGTMLAIGHEEAPRAVQTVARAWIDVTVNTPLIVKLFLLFFLLRLSPLPSTIVALSLHQASFIAVILQGGLAAVSKDIDDVAFATGLGQADRLVRLKVPLGLRLVAPALVLQILEIVKNSSIASLIGVEELTYGAERYQGQTFQAATAFASAAVLYAALTLVITCLGRSLEIRLVAQEATG